MKFLQNILLLILFLIIALLAAEYSVRMIYSDISSTNNMKSWFGVRWANQHIVHNERGMREKSFSNSKPPGTYRIAILGDSFTVGQGIAVDARYSNQLERILSANGLSAEVLNFSRPGMNTVSEATALKEMVLQAKPDFVLLQWLPNDFAPYDFSSKDKAARQRLPSMTPFSAAERLLQYRSALYFLLHTQWTNQQIAANESTNYRNYLHEHAAPGSNSYQAAREALADIARVTRADNIQLGVILLPLLTDDLHTAYSYVNLHTTVMGWCAELEIDCVDLQPILAGQVPSNGATVWWVNKFDPHPNTALHKIIAAEILQQFGRDFAVAETASDQLKYRR